VRPSLPVAGLLLTVAACGGAPAPTQEDLALRVCNPELTEQLAVAEGDVAAQTQMIGRREGGWLVRGLSTVVQGAGAQNDECRLDDAGPRPPTLTYLRLCEAGESPWGCPS
jgi:hypothetical protein